MFAGSLVLSDLFSNVIRDHYGFSKEFNIASVSCRRKPNDSLLRISKLGKEFSSKFCSVVNSQVIFTIYASSYEYNRINVV